jgi:hypothetical protein
VTVSADPAISSATVNRYKRRHVELSDGRRIFGRAPGMSAVTLLEHRLRDELAVAVRGITEATLPFGRADVLTAETAFEVKSFTSWRSGVRQAIAYSVQTGCRPGLALFGKASRAEVLAVYLKLRNNRPPVDLWWHSGLGWEPITSRVSCRCRKAPEVLR